MADIEENIDASLEKLSKGERKARKALEKLGLKPVPNVKHVTMKKGSTHIEIAAPQVFKAAGAQGTETFVAYGKFLIYDSNARRQGELAAYARQLQAAAAASGAAAGAAPAATTEEPSEANIQLVMTQGSTTREAAVAALKESGNKPVDALMKLMTA